MKSILKATAVLGSASVVSILMGLLSAKVSAVLLGPSGMGYMGLLQSLLGLSGMIAGMGVGAGLVRSGARALKDQDSRQMAALRAAAWLVCGVLGGATVILMVLARTPLSHFMLGSPDRGGAVVITAAGLLLTLAAGVQTSILNAHHRVGALARCSMLSSVLGVSISLILIWGWRAAAIPWAVLAGCLATWAISAYFLRRCEPRSRIELSRREILEAVKGLLRFGAPFTASMLVGAGVTLALPILVLHLLNTEAVGYYRAAATVSVTYLGFVTASLAQDYYPRVSAVADRKEILCQLINDQHRLLMLLGGPLILGMLALVPYLVPLIFSDQFGPTVALLEWQLAGDIFKLAAWTLAFVILARSGSLTFFLIELVGGASMLALSWLGARWAGLEGIGMAFVACAALYYLLCWIILRRGIAFRWNTQNLLLFASFLMLAFIIRALPYLDIPDARTPVALLLATLAALYSLRTLRKEVGGYGELIATLRGRGRTAPIAAASRADQDVPPLGVDMGPQP